MVDTVPTKLNRILDRLSHVKATGAGKWLARCPAHDDRSPSLAIREADERILIHCFSGCGVSQVLQAVGLQMADLFPNRFANPYAPKPRIPKFSAYELFPLLVQEAVILALAWSDTLAGKVLSETDQQRVQQAFQSVMRLHSEVSR
ncbi:DNA primase [Methylomonas koyamae]|uniref:DNA primase n=1 Tax=Methylomonas koyamae TaxID=702114 RepID=UPI000BC2FAF7|nr:DNA primase [Methylomonas koyamae]ATG91416.1 hypothetical protein MKLM6_3224 [Methylomonas koyamae]